MDNKTLTPKKMIRVLLILLVILLAVSGISLVFGGASTWTLSSLISFELEDSDRQILGLRFLRICMAIATGGALGACGVILQALLRNPLAYPHILGISGGAAVGGIAAQLFGFYTFSFLGVVLPGGTGAAFITALLSTYIVYKAASFQGRMDPISLILVGVVFNAFAGALILFFFSMSDNMEAKGILYWMVGSLDAINGSLVWWGCGISLVG